MPEARKAHQEGQRESCPELKQDVKKWGLILTARLNLQSNRHNTHKGSYLTRIKLFKQCNSIEDMYKNTKYPACKRVTPVSGIFSKITRHQGMQEGRPHVE